MTPSNLFAMRAYYRWQCPYCGIEFLEKTERAVLRAGKEHLIAEHIPFSKFSAGEE